jgi:hypothetical protein
MSVTLFGTCRLNYIKNNQLNNLLNYCHSTKEIIQLILFLKGELCIPSPYNRLCFRTAICEDTTIEYKEDYHQRFIHTDLFILEICSIKKYMHRGYYMHHLPFDKLWHKFDNYNNMRFIDHTPRDVLEQFTIEKQTDAEIEQDLLDIQKMLSPKKILVVSHYDSKKEGVYIKSRHHLIQLLDSLCHKHHIPFINPTVVLSKYTQEQVMTSDLGHYTSLGLFEIANYIHEFKKGMSSMA